MATLNEAPHSAFRREVRERALVYAADQLNDVGWDQVRFGAIAEAVGVSRPTIYAEFGNKDGLAEALIMRETARFLAGITGALINNSDQPIKAVERAVAFTLKEAEASNVIRAMLTSGTSGSDGNNSLLPFITTRSEPIMTASSGAILEWFKVHSPETPRQELRDVVDTLVRLLISHVVAPAARPRQVPAKFGRLTARLLPNIQAPAAPVRSAAKK